MLGPDGDVELDVRVGFRAARVVLFVLLSGYCEQVPLCAAVVVHQVNASRHFVERVASRR